MIEDGSPGRPPRRVVRGLPGRRAVAPVGSLAGVPTGWPPREEGCGDR